MSDDFGFDENDLPDAGRCGLYPDMSHDQYLREPGLSSSAIRQILRSPAHYKFGEREETEAFKIGTLVHAILLEPEEFGDRYLAMGERVKRNTKAGKSKYEEGLAQAQAEGKTLLLKQELDQIEGMRASVWEHNKVRKLLSRARRELSGFWSEEDVLAKARFDCIPTIVDNLILDIKSTEDAQVQPFMRSVFKYGYDKQAGWYCRAGRVLLGMDNPRFAIVAVEKKPPYACKMYEIHPNIVATGEAECLRAVGIYRECLKSGEWPGYSEDTTTLADWKTAREEAKKESHSEHE